MLTERSPLAKSRDLVTKLSVEPKDNQKRAPEKASNYWTITPSPPQIKTFFYLRRHQDLFFLTIFFSPPPKPDFFSFGSQN